MIWVILIEPSENMKEFQCETPFVHPIVDQRINSGVSHGQPIEGQVHVWRVPANM